MGKENSYIFFFGNVSLNAEAEEQESNSQPMACRTGAEAIWVTPFFLVQYIYSTMTEHLRSRDG